MFISRDRALAEELAVKKLDAEADRLTKAGWAWVRAELDIPYTERQKYVDAGPVERAKPTPEEQERLDTLVATMKETEPDSDEWWDHELARRGIQAKIAERDTYPEGTGVLVSLEHNGLRVHRGVWLPGEAPRETSGTKRAESKPTGPLVGLSRKAVTGLRNLRGHVVRANLTHQLAKQVLTYTLARKVFGPVNYWSPPLDWNGLNHHHDDEPRYPPLQERVEGLPLGWLEEDDPWSGFLKITANEQDELLTVAVASLLGAQLTTDTGDYTHPEFEDIATNLLIDWGVVRPTANLIWGAMPKGAALAAARKALGNTKRVKEMTHLKKGDLVHVLESYFAADAPTKKGREWVVPGLTPKS